MNDDWMNETVLYGGYSWQKEDDGTYTKILSCTFKDGTKLYQVIEENVSEKDYFMRKLQGHDRRF